MLHGFFFFFLREFQLMASTPNNNSSLLDRDINQFLVYVGIEPQIFYSTIRDFIN